jgi:hypothetical protein
VGADVVTTEPSTDVLALEELDEEEAEQIEQENQ